MQNEVNNNNVNNQTNNNSVENSPVINNQVPIEPTPVVNNQSTTNDVSVGTNSSINNGEQMMNNVVTPNEYVTTGTPSVNTENTKKGNKVVPIIIVLIVAVLAICAVYAYINFTNNPTNGFKSVINKAYESLHETITENEVLDFDIQNDALYLDGTLTVNGSLLSLDELKNDELKFNLGMDYKNNQLILGGTLNENNKTLIDGTLYYQDTKAYISSNTLFSNIYEAEIEDSVYSSIDIDELEELMNNNISTDDLDETIKMLKDALIDSLDENNMVITDEKLTINEKEISVKKTSYKLTKETIKNLLSTYADAILSNDDLLDRLAKLSDTTKDEIKTSLEELKSDEYYEDFDEDKVSYMNIYTTGKLYEFVKIELINDNVTAEYTNYNDYIYLYLNDKTDNIKVELTGITNNDVTDVTVKYADEEIATLKVRSLTNDLVDVDYEVYVEGTTISGNVYISNIVSSNNNSTYEISLSAEALSQDIEINLNGTLKVTDSLDFIDTSKAIKTENMTESDALQYSTVMNDLQNSNLYKWYNSMFGYSSYYSYY